MLATEINIEHFNSFEMLPPIKNQIKIEIARLLNNPECARILEILLCKSPAIDSVQASSKTTTVQIKYDPVRLSVSNLVILLDKILLNIPDRVNQSFNNEKASKKIGQASLPAQLFSISGIKCSSCALFIEVFLNRQAEVQDVCLDFNTALLKIVSSLTEQRIVSLIQESGFEVSVLLLRTKNLV